MGGLEKMPDAVGRFSEVEGPSILWSIFLVVHY